MRVPRKRRATTDAVEIIHRRYYKGKPERLAALEEERANAEIARKIHELRTKTGLTQKQLATLVGTTTSVICRLEDADYEGHSLSMLRPSPARSTRGWRFASCRQEIRYASLDRLPPGQRDLKCRRFKMLLEYVGARLSFYLILQNGVMLVRLQPVE